MDNRARSVVRLARAAGWLAIGLLLAVVAAHQLRQGLHGLPQAGPLPVVTGEARVGGPFRLVDQDGRSRTDRDFLGKTVLLVFGCTACPDDATAMLQVAVDAVRRQGPAAGRFQTVLITTDPAKDTPERLRSFVAGFQNEIVALTGTIDDIASVAKLFHIPSRPAGSGSASISVVFDVNPAIYLLDDAGRFIELWTLDDGIPALHERLDALQ